MKCKCGYDYAKAMLKILDTGECKYKSYATIDDENYRTFLRRERKVLQAKGKYARIKAIAKSAELVGSIKICPDCGLMLFLPTEEGEREFYRRVKVI